MHLLPCFTVIGFALYRCHRCKFSMRKIGLTFAVLVRNKDIQQHHLRMHAFQTKIMRKGLKKILPGTRLNKQKCNITHRYVLKQRTKCPPRLQLHNDTNITQKMIIELHLCFNKCYKSSLLNTILHICTYIWIFQCSPLESTP